MRGELYPPLFGAGEVQRGHGGKKNLHEEGDAAQVTRGEGISILGGLHGWVRQSHGLSGPVLVMVLFWCALTMMAQIMRYCVLRTGLEAGLFWVLPGFRKN